MNDKSDDLKRVLLAGLLSGATVAQLCEMLVRFKNEGGAPEIALKVLDALRKGRSDGEDDKILEVLDVVSGWCQKQHRIWSEQ